ncbi:pentapeptide repeat-containing protein [Oculatella sp. LEGE 06141]|uniref:pentapeptide repeat-containing protein n=1 Tax=Oculatella sp. LEGE 06141 TaxID=1828648 RepID=UPI001D145D28|nr:pentapeptide repeat-containing protein [Oculatella sp. LEGE 06141]
MKCPHALSGWLPLVVLMGGIPAIAQTPDAVTRLIETGACRVCDLSNANLSGMNLSEVDLTGAILVGADLSNADLRRARLRGAILNAANLSGADFRGANLNDASLYGAVINPPADFSGATLEYTIMPNGTVYQP